MFTEIDWKQIPKKQNIKKCGYGLVSSAYPIPTGGALTLITYEAGVLVEIMRALGFGRPRVESWFLLGLG